MMRSCQLSVIRGQLPATFRQWLLGACVLGLALPARAQQVLVQGDVANDTIKTMFGPNRQYFGHAYVGYGMVAGASAPGAALRYGFPSAELQLGGRLKRRISQTLALNLDLRYAYLNYGLEQDAAKRLPDARQHRSEKLGLHQLQTELSLRLNAAAVATPWAATSICWPGAAG
jgi:hypothetical protein